MISMSKISPLVHHEIKFLRKIIDNIFKNQQCTHVHQVQHSRYKTQNNLVMYRILVMYYWQSNAEETTTYVEMDSYQSQLFVLMLCCGGVLVRQNKASPLANRNRPVQKRTSSWKTHCTLSYQRKQRPRTVSSVVWSSVSYTAHVHVVHNVDTVSTCYLPACWMQLD